MERDSIRQSLACIERHLAAIRLGRAPILDLRICNVVRVPMSLTRAIIIYQPATCTFYLINNGHINLAAPNDDFAIVARKLIFLTSIVVTSANIAQKSIRVNLGKMPTYYTRYRREKNVPTRRSRTFRNEPSRGRTCPDAPTANFLHNIYVFTTMYNGNATEVVSRLKTVTNTVTETIKPTVVVPAETKTLSPLTYFTTFTYWTTFIKGDDTATTSREETVSNIVTPGLMESSAVQLDVVKTYRPFVLATPLHTLPEIETSKIHSETSEMNDKTVIDAVEETPTLTMDELTSSIELEPVTLYTTYTYFTTSYIGNSTLLNSRLETVTSVSQAEKSVRATATPRAIGGAAPASQILNTDDLHTETYPVDSPSTGLLSTKRHSTVNDGITTHYTTEIYGTYVDGLYAQVLETSSNIELPSPVYSSSATPGLPIGLISLNRGSIVDADSITTTFYTTKQIGTTIDDSYTKFIESTTSTKIDEDKLATYTAPANPHRDGLVRLIEGQIEINGTTTYYQSKVIGTSISGRYAQIIESSSSVVLRPTSTLNFATLQKSRDPNVLGVLPSPAVIQSSLSEDASDDALNDPDHEEIDSDIDDKLKKKSRLSFVSRKKPSSAPPIRPFASRSRPTFNPKRKPQGATTITRSDITPTITATLTAGKGRYASSKIRSSPSSGLSTLNSSNSRRFSGRKSSSPSSSIASTNYPSASSKIRGSIRTTPSSYYSSTRRVSTPIRGSSIRSINRGSSILPVSVSRSRLGIRASPTVSRAATVKQEELENVNDEESSNAKDSAQDNPEDESNTATAQTTTESGRKPNPLVKFRRLTIATRPTTSKPTTTTNAPRRINTPSRNVATTRSPPVQRNTTRSTPKARAGILPSRNFFVRKPEANTESERKNKQFKEEEQLPEEPVREITDNDYEGSEQKENDQLNSRGIKQIKPFASRTSRVRRVRRQAIHTRQAGTRGRRPSWASEEVYDTEPESSNSRYGTRSRSSSISRSNPNLSKEDLSEEYYDLPPMVRGRPPTPNARTSPPRIKPSIVSNTNRQFTLREKDTAIPSYKRTTTPSRVANVRSRTNTRNRVTSNRYQDVNSMRRSPSRTTSRNGSRNNNRRVTSVRGRMQIKEDYRDYNDFDGTITVTHYVPTEVTIPVVNNGVTEKRNIITAAPSTAVIGPEQYMTSINSKGQDVLVLATENTATNFQGQTEITKFVIHETPTTKVSHTLTSAGGRRFSQPVVVPSTIYSVENVVSTIRPSLIDNVPLANILLSQLLLGQLGQTPLVTSAPAVAATPTTKFETRATTYVTTITKHQSTVIPLTFRGKEILTTLVDSTTDVVTATEFITDTVVVTPTAVLPAAANLNSLLLLLKQPQNPLANPLVNPLSNSLLDPLFSVAPSLTHSNTLPGETERRNQPVDLDYKSDSYEDLGTDDVERSSLKIENANSIKLNERELADSSVVTFLSALGPMITAMAGLLQGKKSAARRNDSESVTEAMHTTTQRSPIYIPVAEFVDGDSETAESQSIDQVVNTNWNKHDGPKRPNIQFSLHIDSNSHEKESHSQTESPPIGIMDSKVQKNKSELLSTAYQTNFMQPNKDTSQLNSETKKSTPKLQYVSQFVSPPKPPEPTINLQMTHDLKPPTTLTEVLGLTPPPMDKLTTSASLNKTQALRKYTDVSGMRPPPPQRPSPKETKTIPLPPDTKMIPPTSSTVKHYNTKVTHVEVTTITRTRTAIVSSKVNTRTLLLTHTLTSTSVETVTETYLRPTSVVSKTITSTVLHSVIDHVPNYERDHDHESIFVVMSDQNPPPLGGDEVSATVSRPMDADSTATRSCDEMTEPSAKNTHRLDLESTIKPSTKQMLQFDNIESGSTLARSCGETTVQPSTKLADHKCCNKDGRDSASEGHTMAERDVGSTLRLPVQHLPLYNQDRHPT
ncbi:unnamed protein product [Trichogramma brassicae]|uniref:DUF4758 domain-containing protein n=1 Tax=Trichogramma brassicae TaxID=86971 RepID=A0A6H5I223_9HYME|nr:unnamed protein product [Trichogramma brassicae]